MLENKPDSSWNIVAAKDIEEVWPYIVDGIALALETSEGEATPEDTKAGLLAGRTQLALMYEGGATVGAVFTMLDYPQFRIARVLLLFGKGMLEAREMMEAAEQWAKSKGCRYIEGWVATGSRRRLFSRFGYRDAYTIVRKAL